MGTFILEDNELCALSDNRFYKPNQTHLGFLGIGEGKSKAKKLGGEIAGIDAPNAKFKDKMLKVYRTIKGDSVATATAEKNIGNQGGVATVFQVVKDFGSPTTKAGLSKHNSIVRVYMDYDYVNLPKYANDCLLLGNILSKAQADMEAYNQKQAASGASGSTPYMEGLANVVGRLKTQMSQSETLEALKSATSAGKSDSTLNYIAYGLGGLIVLTGIVVLIRKS